MAPSAAFGDAPGGLLRQPSIASFSCSDRFNPDIAPVPPGACADEIRNLLEALQDAA